MNVTLKNIDKVNAVLNIAVTAQDYEPKVEKALTTYRQKATIPGFRKGMVPKSLLKKMVGQSILVEEINKIVSENLYNYIKENKLNILGEPLPSESQKEINFDTDVDFEFSFDLGIAPEINIELSKADKIDYYEIEIDDALMTKQADAIKGRYGKQEIVETAEADSMIKGTLTELNEDGSVKEGGIVVADNAVISPAYFKNDAQKELFKNAKTNTTIVFNPFASCEGNESELTSMLHIEKAACATATANFSFEIKEITSHKAAVLGQEFYDLAFGEGKVTTEEEFNQKVRELLLQQTTPESDYKFTIDARTAIEKKIGDLELPEAFLKRWLASSNENKSAEEIEKEFPEMLPELKWHLIKEELVKYLKIELANDDVLDMAKKMTQAQFAQYGMLSIPDDLLTNYAQNMLKEKESQRQIVDRAMENKITAILKETVTLKTKTLSQEKFYEMLDKK